MKNKIIINDKIYDNIICKIDLDTLIIFNYEDDLEICIDLKKQKEEVIKIKIGDIKEFIYDEILISKDTKLVYDNVIKKYNSNLYSLLYPKICTIEKTEENNYKIHFKCDDKNQIDNMHEEYDIKYIEVEIEFEYQL